jgi:hypothetical protein
MVDFSRTIVFMGPFLRFFFTNSNTSLGPILLDPVISSRTWAPDERAGDTSEIARLTSPAIHVLHDVYKHVAIYIHVYTDTHMI